MYAEETRWSVKVMKWKSFSPSESFFHTGNEGNLRSGFLNVWVGVCVWEKSKERLRKLCASKNAKLLSQLNRKFSWQKSSRGGLFVSFLDSVSQICLFSVLHHRTLEAYELDKGTDHLCAGVFVCVCICMAPVMDKVSLVHRAPLLQQVNTHTEWWVTERTTSPCVCRLVCMCQPQGKREQGITSVSYEWWEVDRKSIQKAPLTVCFTDGGFLHIHTIILS